MHFGKKGWSSSHPLSSIVMVNKGHELGHVYRNGAISALLETCVAKLEAIKVASCILEKICCPSPFQLNSCCAVGENWLTGGNLLRLNWVSVGVFSCS